MRPMRLSHESTEDKEIAPHCAFFLDGEPVPIAPLFVADEALGYVEEGRVVEGDLLGSGRFRWELEPGADSKPRLYRREGQVEIRLKEEAPEWVWRLYEARRAETPG